MTPIGFDLGAGTPLDTILLDGMSWNIPFEFYPLFEAIVDEYNVTLPRDQYVLNLAERLLI